jgi:diguanylate cyclase (GGDEF)-like protein
MCVIVSPGPVSLGAVKDILDRTVTVTVPSNEAARLAALRDLAILDTPAEAIYDDVVALAAAICHTPMAIINFVDADRQWGKALIGVESSDMPREQSMCSRAILNPDELFVVPDTHADPEWADNPMVTGASDVRFYAGAPIVTSEGNALGTVCVADNVVRDFTDAQRSALQVLARQTAAHLDLRATTRALADANDELRRMAVRDGLTGLANRVLLHDRLTLALGQRRRTGREVGVLFGDLNGFKAINDNHGHAAGDELLRIVARRLALASRETDTVARYAGDEFVIVCPDLSAPANLAPIVERAQASVAQPASILGLDVTPHISLGCALATDEDDPDSLIARADAAMYEAKRADKEARARTA